jgi:hypothetical protein
MGGGAVVDPPAGYELETSDDFAGPDLDRSLWLPYYLPQWSSRDAAAARYRLGGGRLRLLVEEDQAPWCPEFDGEVRTSSLQTGVFSGPAGSRAGQHRFADAVVVREPQTEQRLYTPRYGFFAIRARVSDDPASMAALWMIGFEDRPERSAEICVFEIFGRDVSSSSAGVGRGLHAWGDPRIHETFTREPLPLDVREFHVYAAEWRPDSVTFLVDGEVVLHVTESPDYPMQFMLDVFALPGPDGSPPPGPWPKELVVDWFRGYRPVDGRPS